MIYIKNLESFITNYLKLKMINYSVLNVKDKLRVLDHIDEKYNTHLYKICYQKRTYCW